MSQDGIIWATAVWRRTSPGFLEITVDGDTDGVDIPVVMTRDEPTMRGLASTPWTAASGSAWQRDETQSWWIRVYRHDPP
jgi:hypothetical protein